jgi:hypothetical protein
MPRQSEKRTSERKPAVLLAALLAGLLAAPPLLADWLVARDGSRIETKGRWRVEGNKILFELPNGTMGVMRKSEVDIDASAAASASSRTPAATPAPADAKGKAPKKAPVLTLTDKDIRKAVPRPENQTAEEAAAEAKGLPPPTPAGAVIVDSWRQWTEEGVVEIAGVVKNVGADIAVNIALEVEVIDETGKSHTAAGFLDKTSLVRGKDAAFRAIFPEVTQITRTPTFTLTSEGATVGLENKKEPEAKEEKPPGEKQN